MLPFVLVILLIVDALLIFVLVVAALLFFALVALMIFTKVPIDALPIIFHVPVIVELGTSLTS